MTSKPFNQQKSPTAKINSDQAVLSPFTPLLEIYDCYAQILKAARLTSFYESKINLSCHSTTIGNERFVLDNFLLLYVSQQRSLSINAHYIVASSIDLPQLKYQLSSDLFNLMTELKITPALIHPHHLLNTLNNSLSKQAIYDLNFTYYQKPRCELSFDLLAKLIGCSRHQLQYQQQRINSAYAIQIQKLTEKCEALQHSKPSSEMFWRAQDAN